MKKCAIIGCANTSERNPSVNFFSSPNSNQKDRRNIWIAATGRTYNEGAKFCVCEEHFDMSSDVEYYMLVADKPKLLRSAVPHLKIFAPSVTSEVFKTSTATSTANVSCSTVSSASILPFIKKEEPADFYLTMSEETHIAETEPSYNPDNYVPTTEFFSITFKVEPNDEPTAHSWNSGTDEKMKDPEYIDGGGGMNFSGNEMTDEDWIDDAKRKKSKSPKVRNRRRKCPECPFTYLRRDLLRDHMKNHTDNSKVECHKCLKFIPKSYLECHLQIHEGPPFICKICGKSFQQKDSFRGHRKVHWERKYECDVCHKLFVTKTLLGSHLQVHVEREKTFQCPICSASFHRKNTLQHHHRQMHTNRDTNTSRKKFKCTNPICQREYLRKEDFKRHKCREIVAKFKCPHCSSKFCDRSKRIEHIRQCHNKQCDKCDKSFRDPHKMQLHVAQNCTERIVYDCDLCSVQIVGKPDLMKHFANRHQTYECEYCRRIFQSQGILLLHINHICTTRAEFMEHSNAQSFGHFECDICGWKFSQKLGIVEHMRIMHSMKSFAGPYFAEKFTCFTNRATLQLYPCCDKQYVNKASNPMHLPTAKCKYFCKRCRATYSNFYSMYRHVAEHTTRVHQSIRHMETCERCDRRFKWKVSVPEHLKCVNDSIV